MESLLSNNTSSMFQNLPQMDFDSFPSSSYFDYDDEPKSAYLESTSTINEQKKSHKRVSFSDDAKFQSSLIDFPSQATFKKLCTNARPLTLLQNQNVKNDKENFIPSVASLQKALDMEKERVNYLHFVNDELQKSLDLKDRSLSHAREEQGQLYNRIGRLEDFITSLQGELFASNDSIKQFQKKESEWKKRISELEQELLEERSRDKKVQAYLKQLRKVQGELDKAVHSTFADLNDAKIKFQSIPAATEEKITTRVSSILSRHSYERKRSYHTSPGLGNAADERVSDDDAVYSGLGCINASVITKGVKNSVLNRVHKLKSRSSLRSRLLQEFTERKNDVYLSVTEDMSTLSETIQSLEEALMKTQEESTQLQMLLDRNTKERKKERFGLGYLEKLAAEVSDFLGKKDFDVGDGDEKPDNSFHLAFETETESVKPSR